VGHDVRAAAGPAARWAAARDLVRGDLLPAVLVAAAVVVAHAALSGRYGFHRDELYYVEAGRHPAAGYVDQPPLVPLLARALDALGGGRLWPLRVAAGLTHAATVVAAGLLARRFGGGRWAVGLAAFATAAAPLFVVTGGLFQTVVLDQFWSAVVVLLVARILAGGDPRLWLGVGAVAGVGMQTKWTMALLGVGLAVGAAVVHAARRRLLTPWCLAGAAVALVLWLPNLVWQVAHDWPTLEFTRNNNARVRDEDGRLGFVLQQLLLVGPFAVPLAAAGLVWLARRPPWRAFAVAVGVIAALLLAVGGKAYYLGPTYVIAFAAGAVAAETWVRRGTPEAARRRARLAIGALVINLLVPLAFLSPIAPPDSFATEANAELGEQVGWPDMVDQVAAVVNTLPAEEREDVRVVTASYGEAAAIDRYGPSRGIPRGTALSAHNSYATWWPDDEPAGAVVFVRYRRETVEPFCTAFGPVATVSNPQHVENEVAGSPIVVCHELSVPPDALRDDLRHYR
jgi:4-amino-4-deoxy-L-arabinose transferase-like glycosyltransferase